MPAIREELIRISVRQIQGGNLGVVLSAALEIASSRTGSQKALMPEPWNQPVALDRSLPVTDLLGEGVLRTALSVKVT